MCRLFGMSGGTRAVQATFWLLDAPTSLLLQAETQPDGVGLGTFEPDGSPLLYRKPVSANRSQTFIADAREVRSTTFLAHIRHATAAQPTRENTHPFEQHGRIFAHNGVLRRPRRSARPARPSCGAAAGRDRLRALLHAGNQTDRGGRRRHRRRDHRGGHESSRPRSSCTR